MENIELVCNCDFNRWKDAVQITGTCENWIFSAEDYNLWNEGLGPENFNFLCAIDKTTGKTVGHIASAYYPSIDGSEPLATAGAYFVCKDYRGTGVGMELSIKIGQEERFAYCNQGTISVASMTKKYALFGLSIYPEWQYEDMEAKVSDCNPDLLESNPNIKTVALNEVDSGKFIEYDTKICGGIRRDKFIQKVLESKTAFSRIAIDKNENIVGFGNIRIGFNNQLAIGPLYADSDSIAETLLKDCLKLIPNLNEFSLIYYYPSSTTLGAKDIFYKLASKNVKENDRMFVQFSSHVPKVCS
uniref:YitH acetyltransferase (GNAT) domain-containing protein n=1 Tax=Panagrolaimus davidi TaxID=227884 RepID=A0A914PJQ3_9BILA